MKRVGIALLVLSVLDSITTYVALRFGFGTEANGIASALMNSIGLIPALVVRVLLGAVVVGLLWWLSEGPVRAASLARVTGAVIVAWWTLVVANNIVVLVR
jgi:hypothetical protein